MTVGEAICIIDNRKHFCASHVRIGKNMSSNVQGFNQGSIQNMNRTLLINLLRKQGICSRSTLASLSGLKQATVTYIVNDFMKWNLVRENGFMTGLKGRRSIGITINSEDFGVIGVRIARQNYSVGLFDLTGAAVLVKRQSVNEGDTSRETFDRIKTLIAEMMETKGNRRLLAVGAALPGPYNFRSGHIELMTGVPGWSEIQVKEELEKLCQLPVFVEQDANAAAMAQFWYSDEEDPSGKLLVYYSVGQGVGAGIVNDGRLIKGSIGAAGEIGHTSINFQGPACACGNRGCLENYCSTIAFTKMVNEAKKPETPLTFEDAVILVNQGDADARNAFLTCCDYMSVGIVNLLNMCNPDLLVIGDEMAHVAPDQMQSRILANVKARVIPQIFESTHITMSMVERDSMVHGAAIVAIRAIFDQTATYFGGDDGELENETE